MEFRHLAITLSVICYAVTAYGQVLSGKDENSERTQSSQQQRHDLDENLLKKAVQQASGFGELDTRKSWILGMEQPFMIWRHSIPHITITPKRHRCTSRFSLSLKKFTDLKTRMWLPCLMS